MDKNDLSYLSVEELKQKIKLSKVTIVMFLTAQVLLLVSSIYMTIKKGQFTPLMIIPITFLPLIIIQATSIKKLKAEIASRGEK